MSGYALIVDADPNHAKVVAVVLRAERLPVVIRRDPKEALEIVDDRGPPSIVVVDAGLPGMGGLALIKKLRKECPPERTAVLVTSHLAELRSEALERKAALHLDDILVRGGPPSALVSAVREALQGHRHDRAPKPPAPAPAPDGETGGDPAVSDTEADASTGVRAAYLRTLGPDDGEAQGQSALLADLAESVARAFSVRAVAIVLDRGEDDVGLELVGAHGLSDETQASFPRSALFALCAQVARADVTGPTVIGDAALHQKLAKDPWVQEGLLRSAVGVRLAASDGQGFGALFLVDDKPSRLSAHDLDRFVGASRRIAGQIALRRSQEHLDASLDSAQRALAAESEKLREMTAAVSRLRHLLDALELGVLLLSPKDHRVVYANVAFCALWQRAPADLIGLTRDALIDEVDDLVDDIDDIRAALRVDEGGAFEGAAEIELVHPRRRVLRWQSRPITLDDKLTLQLSTFTDVTAKTDLMRERIRWALLDPERGGRPPRDPKAR